MGIPTKVLGPALVVLVVATAGRSQAQPDRVLFVGNSLTYSRGGVDTMVNNLCAASGVPMAAERETVGGMRLSEHAVRAETLARIRQGGWDVVVLQGHSNDATEEHESFVAGARTLDAEVRAIGARTVLYMTWAYQDQINGDMTQQVADAYLALGDELDAEVVPCGLAWQWMCDNTALRMYDDNIHPSQYGVYLVGCMFYAALLNTSPVGNSYYAEYGIGSVVARNIQTLAWSYASATSVAIPTAWAVPGAAPASVKLLNAGLFGLAGRVLHAVPELPVCHRTAWTVAVTGGSMQLLRSQTPAR